MQAYEFFFPDDYDSEAPIIESKGWMTGTLKVSGRVSYTLCFCSAIRLQQDVNAELAFQPCFVQKNLIVVPEVTKAIVLRAIDWLVSGDSMRDLVSDAGPGLAHPLQT